MLVGTSTLLTCGQTRRVESLNRVKTNSHCIALHTMQLGFLSEITKYDKRVDDCWLRPTVMKHKGIICKQLSEVGLMFYKVQ